MNGELSAFAELLRANRNYRFLWSGQIVSEVGDHFNNIAVMSLAMQHVNPGLVVTGVFLSRAVPMLAAGPIAGVLLDRMDRKRIMIASDMIRTLIAFGFILSIHQRGHVAALSAERDADVRVAVFQRGTECDSAGDRNFGRTAHGEHDDADNVMGQPDHRRVSGRDGDATGVRLGVRVSTRCRSLFRRCACRSCGAMADSGRSKVSTRGSKRVRCSIAKGWITFAAHRWCWGSLMISMGWASGGGAAQILFSLFGEKVFNAGPMGIGVIWGFAGIGLLIGGTIAYRLGKVLSFAGYKRTIAIAYLIHGGAYVLFSQMPTLAWACVFITLSRAAVAVSSVLNTSQLLHHVEDRYRGRVFATNWNR